MLLRIEHLGEDQHVQRLISSPFFIDILSQMHKISDLEQFNKDLWLFVMSGQVGDKEKVKAALLKAVHLVADCWEEDHEISCRDYASSFSALSKSFLKMGEPQIALDCQLLALNIGYATRYWYVREDVSSKRNAICRLLHIDAFESAPSREFLDHLGRGVLFARAVRIPYQEVQKACREFRKSREEIEAMWAIDEDVPLGELVYKNGPILKALYLLHCLENLESSVSFPDQFRMPDLRTNCLNISLKERCLELHHDLQIHPDYFLRSLDRQCVESDKWTAVIKDIEEVLSKCTAL